MNLILKDELTAILTEELSHLPDRDEAAESLPAVAQTPRSRAMRRISEIASSRGWNIAVVRALDANHASHVDDLTDDALFWLRDQMEHHEDCAQHGCDPSDAFPAR